MSGYRKDTGAWGEDSAALHIAKKGFTILSRNYRAGKTGEIDIVARLDNLIVFFEVKTRNSRRYGGALYSIGQKKIYSMKYCARHFIHNFYSDSDEDITIRFDLISIQDGNVEWIEDIIRW